MAPAAKKTAPAKKDKARPTAKSEKKDEKKRPAAGKKATPKKGKKKDGEDAQDEQDDTAQDGQDEVKVRERKWTLDAKRKAYTGNPKGVRAVGMSAAEGSQSVLAGYLSLPNTESLRQFVDEEKTKDILTRWHASREKNFSCNEGVGQKNGMVQMSQLMTVINSTSRKDQLTPEFFQGLELPFGEREFSEEFMSREDPMRAVVAWLSTMFKIIKLHPENFTGNSSSSQPGGDKYLCDIVPEDWHRSYWLLRSFNKAKQPARSKEKEKPKPQTRPAMPPYFLTDAEALGQFEEDGTSKLTMVNLALEQALEAEKEIEEEESSDEEDTKRRDPTKDFDMSGWERMKLAGKPIHDDLLPRLAHDDIVRLLKTINDRVGKRRLWPPSDHNAQKLTDDDAEVARRLSASSKMMNSENAKDDLEKTIDLDKDLHEKAFWDLQRAINQVSSMPPTVLEACSILKLDPHDAKTWVQGKKNLQIYQVQGIAWSIVMLTSGGGIALLSDDVGLGKTIEAIGVVARLPELEHGLQDPKENLQLVRQSEAAALLPEREAELKEGSLDEDQLVDDFVDPVPVTKLSMDNLRIAARRYKPTLVVIPNVAVPGWRTEFGSQDDLTVRYWLGDKDKTEWLLMRDFVKPGIEDLREFIRNLDANDARTQKVVVVTTYQTLRYRTLRHATVKLHTPTRKPAQKEAEEVSFFDIEDEEEEASLSEEEQRSMKSLVQGLFGLVVLDEAHKAKNAASRTNLAIRRLHARRVLLLTATPTPNRLHDLRGTLAIFHDVLERTFGSKRDATSVDDDDTDSDEGDEDEPAPLSLDDYEKMPKLTTVSLGYSLKGLVPYMKPTDYGRILGTGTSTTVIKTLCRPLLSALMLRRVKGQTVVFLGKEHTIAQSIPPFRITTHELAMNSEQARLYIKAHDDLIGNLSRRGKRVENDDNTRGNIHMGVHRFLCHATTDPALDSYRKVSAKKVTASALAKLAAQPDGGYTAYHKITRPRPGYPPYPDRTSRALQISSSSVKLEELCGIINDVCFTQDRKLMIWAEWPAIMTLVEIFLTVIGIPFYALRAAYTQAQRHASVVKFNNPDDDVKIMICSSRSAATSFNAQQACSDMVILEWPWNLSTVDQMVGRLWRVGQTREVNVRILSVDHSYDQVLQARATKKVLAQLASQATASDEVEGGTNDDDSKEEEESGTYKLDEGMVKKCTHFYQTLYGFRSPRHDWDNHFDLALKDKLDTENGYCIPGRPSVLTRYKPNFPIFKKDSTQPAISTGLADLSASKQLTLKEMLSGVGKASDKKPVDEEFDQPVGNIVASPIGDSQDPPLPLKPRFSARGRLPLIRTLPLGAAGPMTYDLTPRAQPAKEDEKKFIEFGKTSSDMHAASLSSKRKGAAHAVTPPPKKQKETNGDVSQAKQQQKTIAASSPRTSQPADAKKLEKQKLTMAKEKADQKKAAARSLAAKKAAATRKEQKENEKKKKEPGEKDDGKVAAKKKAAARNRQAKPSEDPSNSDLERDMELDLLDSDSD